MGEEVRYLEEFFEVKNGYAFKSKEQLVESTSPSDLEILKQGHIARGGGLRSSPKRFFVAHREQLERYILSKGDIVMAMTDMKDNVVILGVPAIVDESSKYVLNQRVGWLKPRDGVCTNFFYYQFLWREFIEELRSRANSGVQVNLSSTAIRESEVWCPIFEEQEAIAEVLSSLDDKIGLLKRQNKTLEGMAEALFRQWFIEEAQDDWEVCTFGDFFPVKTGKKDANYSTEDGPYPFFTCSQEVSKSPDFSFNGKAILLAGNGNFNVKRYNGKFEAYQRTYVLIPEDPSLHAWLFFHLRFALQKIVMGSRGSVISFLTKGLIQNHEFTKPPELEKQKLDELDKLLEATDANDAQIKNLTLQRDTLLPKLMSGEVRVQID